VDTKKTLRGLQVALALLALLVFATVVVADIHHHDSAIDSHCAFCHLSHQTVEQAETAEITTDLSTVASLPLPEDATLAFAPVFSSTASRAPPLA
jgi:hypothetical protein